MPFGMTCNNNHMNNQIIELESIFTPWTLDMYQTFDFARADEMILEDLGGEYDDYNWDYDCQGYLKALADNRLDLLRDNILDEVIVDILYDGEPISPAYYNFTTDKTFNRWLVNVDELENFITENADDFLANKLESRDGFWWSV